MGVQKPVIPARLLSCPLYFGIVEQLCAAISDASWQQDPKPQPHETATLRLDSSKVKVKLGWTLRWSIPMALDKIFRWHLPCKSRVDMRQISLAKMRNYSPAEGHS